MTDAPERIGRRTQFDIIPRALAFDPRLKPQAKILYAWLTSYALGDDVVWPGLPGIQRRLAEHGDDNPPSVSTLKRWLKQLVDAEWVRRKRRPGTSSLTWICSEAGELAPWQTGQQSLHGSNMSPPNGSNMSPPNGSNMSPKKKETQKKETQKKPGPPDKVARWVMEHRPNNTHKFLAVRQVAKALLDAGWSEKQVAEAMVNASTVTIRAVEVELNRSKPKTRRLEPSPVDTAEDGQIHV